MTDRHPPRLAVWLLKRQGAGRENEALLGDLIEEFEDGRSAGWFWRQTFEAFTVASNRVMPGLAMQLLVLFVAWGVPAALFFELSWERVPLGALHVTDDAWPISSIWVALYMTTLFRIRQERFLEQIRNRLFAFVALSCVYMAAARWIGWGGWSGLLTCCMVSWIQHSAEVSGMAFRRVYYRRPGR